MKIAEDIKYVGVNDKKIDLFEGQYVVPNGMAYNSYLIADKEIAVMDAVDGRFVGEWLQNVERALGELGRTAPEYLVVQHMEPDHSAGIAAFMEKYGSARLVSSAKAFQMMKNFFGTDFEERRVVVKEGDSLSLGVHNLTFISAPMVHWPEVILTYDVASRVLFSADAFGKFGALDADEDWDCEARRYYFGIVGKYGAQVQALLKKASALDIEVICSLHGPVLNENLSFYIDLYNTWSAYASETNGIAIAYTSVYGNTKKAVELLADALKKRGVQNLEVMDLAREDMAECVEAAFRYPKIVLASTTYNAEVFPFMRNFLLDLAERGWKNKTVAFIENGSWAPMAEKTMRKLLEPCKSLSFAENNVTIMSALSEANKARIEALADELS